MPRYHRVRDLRERELPFSRAIRLAGYYSVSLDHLAGRSNTKHQHTVTALTDDEIRLLRQYRTLTERSKGKAELFIEQLAEWQ